VFIKAVSGLGRSIRGGEPMLWLSAGAVAFSVLAVGGLIWLLAWNGLGYFWPTELRLFEYRDGPSPERVLGEEVMSERVSREQLLAAGVSVDDRQSWYTRRLIKRGNREFTATDFVWLLDKNLIGESSPEQAVRVERFALGNFYGELHSLLDGDREIARSDADPAVTWTRFQQLISNSVKLRRTIEQLEREEVGRINYQLERLRLEERRRALAGKKPLTPELLARQRSLEAEYEAARSALLLMYRQSERFSFRMRLANGRLETLPVGQVVRAILPNRMSTLEKLDYYRVRLWEFISEGPREANTEGGVYPAIFGTVLMVILMSIVVTPFGVLAALYLHEVAGQGRITRVFRAAVNNLAGVPSIVYGIFGLGFFVYGVGGEMDRLFYPEALPAPTFGTPGIMWASLTLALLTLPVVIVAT
jgi:phosphate transport system permease protein